MRGAKKGLKNVPVGWDQLDAESRQKKNTTLQMSANRDFSIDLLPIKSDGFLGTTSSDQKGPVLHFYNICYHVKEKRGFLFKQKITEKKILSDINGIMNPGLNAIVGPSVSGNTLLLDILAARKDPSGISGDVWVHEVPEDSYIPHNTGYVVQDDVVMDTLSVRENLWFSAALRLPTTMTKQEKKERINNIIKELGLEEVADSKGKTPSAFIFTWSTPLIVTHSIPMQVVSEMFWWNLKEKEKKTSIGMELILDPLILFLDEPTTGLDGRTANDVFTLLKRISQQGRTIIFTIHQPCYSIFKLFDSLTILASGELMYHGPAQKALEYFQLAGEGVISASLRAAESVLTVRRRSTYLTGTGGGSAPLRAAGPVLSAGCRSAYIAGTGGSSAPPPTGAMCLPCWRASGSLLLVSAPLGPDILEVLNPED
ncbi:broad substrate specificity ATP-binding cassette transporter ABCG2-like [Callospermophilus lateralis]|uniref:broad substrate specificity ATP-binding cassette transporter ABCG2-like n=1 Tax=Callospermophilus lateralis TaxID=76772 RepID=UPI0040538D2A